MLNPVPRHGPRKATFLTSGLHAHAASVYTYTHPHDDDMDHKNASHSSTGDLAYFPPASTYHHTSPRAQSPPRKRRSSITSAASPMSPMKLAKSPARAAGNAWHIANVAASFPRSRSGSLVQNVASEETRASEAAAFRTRKPLTNRRPIALLFAPTPPPPSAPLPALPLCAPARPPLSRLAIQPALPPADVFFANTKLPVSPVPSSPSSEFYHAPGVWKSFGTIDEMKEN
ncbi:hypothetical protein B0H14DRAFT_3872758 [Mycena olivaceomarginata]|nr:hypothetical protein B0H14DRAFT_3872758 [Mycena olivaceomarginata]